MARLHANVSFRFESESVEAAGADLRRLADAAERTGFELIRGKVTPAPPDDENEGWTSYAPLDSEPNRRHHHFGVVPPVANAISPPAIRQARIAEWDGGKRHH